MIHAFVATFFLMLAIVVGLRAIELGLPVHRPWADRVAEFRRGLWVPLLIIGVGLIAQFLEHCAAP